MLSEKQILRNVTQITCLGLSAKDVNLIKSLMRISPNIGKNDFAVLDESQLNSADVIFLNIDNDEALSAYRKINSRKFRTVVAVYAKEQNINPKHKRLKLPIRRNTFEQLLKDIVSTTNKPDLRLVKDADKAKNILVVDDSFPVRKYLQQKIPLLEKELDENTHFDIDFAASGREAVQKIKSNPTKYDAIFLDVMMDDIDGFRICKWLKSASRKIKVIMLTSKDSRLSKVKGVMSGCDHYLTKPPSDGSLVKVLADV